MEQSSSKIQMRICRQFDSFCKIVLKNEAIDYERERKRLLRHEVSFSELRHVETICLLSHMSNRKPDSYVEMSLDMEDYHRIAKR